MTRRDAETATRSDHQCLRALLDRAEQCAFVQLDNDYRITHFDRSAEVLFGYRGDHVCGSMDGRHLLVADARPRASQLLDAARLEGAVLYETFEAVSRDTRTFPVRCTVAHGESGWHLLFQNLGPMQNALRTIDELRASLRTDMQQSEKEAEFLRELLRHTIETIRVAIAVTELSSGMIAFVNEQFEHLTGLGRLDVMGHTFDESFRDFPETRARLASYIDRIRENPGRGAPKGTHSWELEFLTGKKDIEIYGRPIVVEGHDNQYILLMIEDQTDRRRLQTQLVQSEKLAAIGQLAAGIAHEIRNPLNTIYNALFDLTEIIEHPSSEIEEDITISMEEIRRVHDIINNLLDFARESERSTGYADLNDVIEKTMRLVQHDLGKKGIAHELHLDHIPDVGMSNNALKQILINLITNAAQAMGTGGRLTIATRRRPGMVPLREAASTPENNDPAEIRLAAHQRRSGDHSYDEHVILEITDTGTGIPSQILPDIFNPFFTTKEPGAGTGLGLSVVHSLVRDAGGAISVRSVPAHGTTFTIELPGVPEEV